MNFIRNKVFIRLAVIAGIILLALLIGLVTDEMALTLDILAAIGLVLIGITILVTVHELGHFLTAKAFGMRVEIFSIGFPPKLFGFTKGETEYQIGATPLGGFVKISGMIDESFDVEHANHEPQPHEFRSKPVWQRLIVMTGGVIMNVILGVLIFSFMKWIYPEYYVPAEELRYGVEVLPGTESLGSMIGFQTGDSLVNFMGESLPYFEDYTSQKNLLPNDAYYLVKRASGLDTLKVPGNIQNFFDVDTVQPTLFLPNGPAILTVIDSMKNEDGDKIAPYPGYAAGLRNKDRIIQVDSVPVYLFSDLREYVYNKPNREVALLVLRGQDTLSLSATTDSSAKLAVALNWPEVFRIDTIVYGLGDAFIQGSKEAFGFLVVNAQGIRNLGREGVDASKSVMGPIQIAKVYLQAFREGGVRAFLRLTAILSMILAFVNILPIPALDGGHVVFLLIEAITRREPSVKVRLVAQQIGMVLVLGLMLLIIFNDTLRLFS